MIAKKTFKAALNGALQKAGFFHKGQSWFLEGKDCIVVVGLQKSDYDEKYYINWGLWLKRLGSAAFPKDNHCHIQSRLTSLFPDDVALIEEASLLDTASPEVLERLVGIVQSKLIPLCVDCSTEQQLRELLATGRFKKSLIMKNAKDALLGST